MFPVARYGESCKTNNDCKQPFICLKKSTSSGNCRCPLNYNIVNNKCSTFIFSITFYSICFSLVGDLNAICTKDTDCSRYMLCSGMNDGTRRCHCQTLYSYDTDRKQCREEKLFLFLLDR